MPRTRQNVSVNVVPKDHPGNVGNGASLSLPINQLHVADTLGLLLVHTNNTLRKLYDRKVIAWRDKLVTVLDEAALIKIARFETHRENPRPLI